VAKKEGKERKGGARGKEGRRMRGKKGREGLASEQKSWLRLYGSMN